MVLKLPFGAMPSQNAISAFPCCKISMAAFALATRTESRISGKEVFNSLNIPGSRKEAMVMLDTILTGVFSSKWFILLSKFLQAVKILRDSSKREAPHPVKAAPLGKRSKRAVPACFSSSATAGETADWVIYRFLLPLPKSPNTV